MTVAPDEHLEVDERPWLGGRVRLRQPVRGYRAALDAALLAAFTPAACDQSVLEVGTGAGAVLTAIGQRCPGRTLTGIERDPIMADLARQNLALNGLEGQILTTDIADGFRALGLDRADWVIANPPYFDDPNAMRPPADSKRGAWMADAGLQGWIGFMLAACQDRGGLALVHRADRLADILGLLGEKAGSFVILPVHPFCDEPAKRVLVRARRSGKAPLRLMPPLILHDREGDRHTRQADAILRGEIDLL